MFTNYYDSAESITITRERAMHELKKHGMGAKDLLDFWADLGYHETYDAQAVLAWLGY